MSERPEPGSDERLADWVDGRMTERERARFEGELRVNPKLRSDLAAYERTVAVLRDALQAPTQPTAVAQRVLARLAMPANAGAERVPVPRRPRGFGPLAWSLLCAAALMAMALLVNSWTRPAGQQAQLADAAGSTSAPGATVGQGEGAPTAVVDPQPVGTAADDTYAGMPGRDPEPDQAAEKRKAQLGADLAAEPVGSDLPKGAGGAESLATGELAGPGAVEVGQAGAAVPPPAAGANPVAPGAVSGPSTFGARGGGGAARGEAAPPAGPAERPAGAAEESLARAAVRREAPAFRMVALVEVEGVVPPPVAEPPVAEPSIAEPAPSVVPAPVGAGTVGSGVVVPGLSKPGTAAGPVKAPPPSIVPDEQLPGVLQQFLASASGATVPGGGEWVTARGSLRIAPVVLAGPADKSAATTERSWLVEGERADVQVLLAQVGALARERQWTLRSSEAPWPAASPTGPATPAAGDPAAASPPASASANPAGLGSGRERLVLRFRLAAR